MIKTRDEILLEFVRNLSENENLFKQAQDPPLPNDEEEQIDPATMRKLRDIETENIPMADPKDVQEIPSEEIPVIGPDEFEEISEEAPSEVEKPIETKEKITEKITPQKSWFDEKAGFPVWVATNHPYAYFTAKIPDYGYVTKDLKTTDMLLENIIANEPEKYFEWRLRKSLKKHPNLKEWNEKAMKAMINKDPEKALLLGVYHVDPFNRLVTYLWDKVVEIESQKPTGNRFPGIIGQRMQDLVKNVILKHHKDYYQKIADDENTAIVQSGGNDPGYSISGRAEPPYGSIDWLAKNHPQVYLKGFDDPASFTGGVKDEEELQRRIIIANAIIRNIIDTDPSKYFEWQLRAVPIYRKYYRNAVRSLIEKDPYKALMFGIYDKRGHEIDDLYVVLWNKIMEIGKQREARGMDKFPGYIFNNLLSLSKIIKSIEGNEDFYKHNIGPEFKVQKSRRK